MSDSVSDVTWKQYVLMVDLYKYYLDLVVRVAALHYAITGAIVSYYLIHRSDPEARWALLLPALLSLGFAAAFLCGAGLHKVTRRHLFDLRDDLGLAAAPETGFLSMFLWIIAISLLLTAAGLTYLMQSGIIVALAIPTITFILSRFFVRVYLGGGEPDEQEEEPSTNEAKRKVKTGKGEKR